MGGTDKSISTGLFINNKRFHHNAPKSCRKGRKEEGAENEEEAREQEEENGVTRSLLAAVIRVQWAQRARSHAEHIKPGDCFITC